MQRISVFCLVTLSYFLSVESLIVPQELPSLLSLVYSTIPQIKKGTDSRFGFGFRLGEHADFQVQLELGPQKETQPIGESTSSSSKRHVNQNDFNAIARGSAYSSKSPSSLSGTRSENEGGSSWLSNWSKDMRSQVKSKKSKSKSPVQDKNNLEPKQIEDIKTAPMVPESVLYQLQTLYKLGETGAMSSSTSTTQSDLSTAEVNQPNLLDIISPRNKNAVPAVIAIDSTSTKPSKDKITEELMNVELE